jgi:CheY-like chemotaxis protein
MMQNPNKSTNTIHDIILIVEDDPYSMMLMKDYIDDLNLLFECASTGEMAINLIIKHPNIKLVLLDIKLPDICGFHLARWIKQTNSKIVIIAQTALHMESFPDKYSDKTFSAIIKKPFTRAMLLDTINRHVAIEQPI